MKCQIISDAHCEFSLNYMEMRKVPVVADTLIVAGDLMPFKYGQWSKFEQQVLSRWKRVIHVPGNHDYYGINTHFDMEKMHDIDDRRKIKPESTYYRIHNGVLELDGVNFLCSTLWTKVMKHPMEVMRNVSDYSQIYGFNININNMLNRLCLEYMKSILDENDGKKYVVVTHHVPLLNFIHEKYKNSLINEAFANDLAVFLDKYKHKIQKWIFGHTHIYYNEYVAGVQFVCNPMGYLESGEMTDFDSKCVVEING